MASTTLYFPSAAPTRFTLLSVHREDSRTSHSGATHASTTARPRQATPCLRGTVPQSWRGQQRASSSGCCRTERVHDTEDAFCCVLLLHIGHLPLQKCRSSVSVYIPVQLLGRMNVPHQCGEWDCFPPACSRTRYRRYITSTALAAVAHSAFTLSPTSTQWRHLTAEARCAHQKRAS